MESRLSWQRAVESAREFDTWVICQPLESDCVGRRLAPRPHVEGLTIHEVSPGPLAQRLSRVPGFFYSAYHRYQQRILPVAQALHASIGFDLVHHVSFCGFREPGYLWKMGIPFVWGPVGGTQSFPAGYFRQLKPWGAAQELSRNVVNRLQLQYRRRVRFAAQTAAHVFAANTTAQRDLARFHSVSAELQLETGLAQLPTWLVRKRTDGGPLRILWAGRFCPWKALPLLLYALAGIRDRLRFELRIVGYGPLEAEWKRLVEELQLDSQTTHVGWPRHEDSFQHYEWADVLAFTSLRDTSGTGLLEALSFGCPIIAVDHQGAHDIVDEECGIPISLTSPASTIQGFQNALVRLAESPGELSRLSRGARRRASGFLWKQHGMRMREVYHDVIRGGRIHHEPSPLPTKNLLCTNL